jgi:hypothetical protein
VADGLGLCRRIECIRGLPAPGLTEQATFDGEPVASFYLRLNGGAPCRAVWGDSFPAETGRGGCHLNDRVFNKDVFKIAAKDVGRADLSAHDLRRFAGSKNAQVATLTENMARLGHKTVGAALRYQHSQDGPDAIVAASLSANALAELNAEAVEQAAERNSHDRRSQQRRAERLGHPKVTGDHLA